MGKQRYSEEYKVEAVKLVLERGLSIKQAALDIGVGKSTMDKWVRVARERKSGGVEITPAELEELKRLKKENRILREERDILKKAAAYFAKDSQKGAGSL